jgi:N-formylglutamate deformylase
MDEATLDPIPRFTWDQLKKRLAEKSPFEAISPLGTALVRVRAYEPLVGLAVHAGHRVREELLSKMVIEESDRLAEEDQGVESLIADFPVQVVGLDSRFEVDLNRPRDKAVYLKPFESWGRKVWLHPPSREELEISYTKHDEFHEILTFLVEWFVAQSGKVFLLDVHTYNDRSPRPGRRSPLPLVNVATSPADRTHHPGTVDFLLSELRRLSWEGNAAIVAENDVSRKEGAVPATVSRHEPSALLLPIDVKKTALGDHPELLRSRVGETAGRVFERFKAP